MSATAEILIHDLAEKGVRLTRSGDRLHVEAPNGAITSELRTALTAAKHAVLAVLPNNDTSQSRRLACVANALGLDVAAILAANDGDENDLTALTDEQLSVYATMLADTTLREQGNALPGETATALCRQCGPIWLHPDMAAVAPVVNGWPRVLGCPWCHNRQKGLPIPRPPAKCGTCENFEPDSVNPQGGLGKCLQSVRAQRGPYPFTQHRCAAWRLKNEH